jgi:glycosyltransferase involved in cell wall biosynthesis
MGVRSRFEPIVLTAFPSHLDLFPSQPVYVQGKGFFGRVYTRLLNLLTGRYTSLTPKQKRLWGGVLTEHRVRLIHAHFGPFAMDLLPLAKKLGIPMVVTFHGADASVYLNIRKYVRELPELVDYARVITVSRDMADRLAALGIKPPRLSVHYIGVPVEDFQYVERRPVGEKLREGLTIRFLQVSNFIEVKGHRFTVEAFSRYAAQQRNAELILAGDGPLRRDIEALCSSLGVGDRVRFTGRIAKDEVIALMSEADAFVQHSVTLPNGRKEGLPTVLMEAMSTGLPVISTLHTGIPELVDHGVNGFLVAERDVDAFVSIMEGLADADPEVGRRAREKVEREFNMSLQNEKLMDIYRRAIDEKVV